MNANDNNNENLGVAREPQRLSVAAQVFIDNELDDLLTKRGKRIENFLKWQKPKEATLLLVEAFDIVTEIKTPSIRVSALQGVAQVYNQNREIFLAEAERMNLNLS